MKAPPAQPRTMISRPTRRMLLAAIALGMSTGAPFASAQTAKKLPYWVAISKDEARMRVGPSMDYPANWIYRRKNLPLKVIETYPNWRRVEDPDGTRGWMHVRLLKDDRTAIIVGETAALRADPAEGSRALYRAEPGVVGRVSGCENGWCTFDVNGQRGYVRTQNLWGAIGE
ncbi:MAG: SH3 domain-containing protein [Sphingobium sp.]